MAAVSGLLATTGPSVLWYLTRATGAVALLLLTGSLVLGIADVRRLSSASWPRFVVDSLHRSVSLLALVFLVVHILTSVLDSYVSISVVNAVVPFTGSYRPLWLGLGAVSFDLMVAVVITSLLRGRVGYRAWRAVHWAAYACWPLALVHGLGTGSDVKSSWLLVLSVVCALAVLAAVLSRVLSGWPAGAPGRRAALAVTAAFTVFVLAWLPIGPLGSEWARRSGTPSSLLSHTTSATSSSTGSTR
ncbi:MAG TPA: ferric reductase-like transmembrane domain-containing protein [Solirubrobacteraceae bacterium]|nr:ferric reductase-like transmembrane domain-containing protein [Solirubrobacteraceae bacterium]